MTATGVLAVFLAAVSVLALMCEACEERAASPFGFPFAHKPVLAAGSAVPQPLAPDDATPSIRPKLVRRHAPAYPVEALRGDKEGWVTLKFQIAPDGVPFNAAVHESSDPVFETASLQAVVKCQYEPAPPGSNLYGGRWFYMRYRFQFEGTPIAPSGQAPDTTD